MNQKILLRKEKGITLIALVITIIVLLILAGVAISMLSGENGILKQAAKAKTQTDEQSTLEQIKLAVMATMTNENHKIDIPTLNDELGKIGYDRGTDNENDIDELPADIEIGGNHFAIKENGEVIKAKWYYDENGNVTSTDGTTLIVGDKISYNSSKDANGNTITGITDPGDWRVLGVQGGSILIMPTSNAEDVTLEGKDGFVNGVKMLNDVCAKYGKGKNAEGARTVTAEDINKITKYDPTSYSDYGTTHTCEGGTFYVDGEWKTTSWFSDPVSVTDTEYGYELDYQMSIVGDLNYTYDSDEPEYQEGKKNIDMIIGNSYWLGTPYIAYVGNKLVLYGFGVGGRSGVFCMYDHWYYENRLFFSDGRVKSQTYGVRPVVSLKSDIVVAPNGAHNWSIQ